MADLNNPSQEVEIVDQTTGYRCLPQPDGTLPIGGAVAAGDTGTTNPIIVSGVDSTNKVRPLITDASGILRVLPVQAAGAVTIQLLYEGALTVINNARWRDIRRYYVPAGYTLDLLKFQHSASPNNTRARVAIEKILGTFDNATNTFTPGVSYTAPAFAASLVAHVTTGGFTVANDVITLTYVNQDGVGGRTATATINRNAVADNQYVFTLQAGDYGVMQVTAVSHTPLTNTTGAWEIEGITTIAYITAVTGNTIYTEDLPSAGIVANPGDQVEIQYMGGNSDPTRISLVGVLKPI